MFRDVTWVSKNGKETQLKDLDENHLGNIQKKLNRDLTELLDMMGEAEGEDVFSLSDELADIRVKLDNINLEVKFRRERGLIA